MAERYGGKVFPIKGPAIETEILASGRGVGSEGPGAIKMKPKWENNRGFTLTLAGETLFSHHKDQNFF